MNELFTDITWYFQALAGKSGEFSNLNEPEAGHIESTIQRHFHKQVGANT